MAVGVAVGVPTAAGQTPAGETDWAARYEELEARVLPYVDEPKGSPADLEPYFQWMERKAVDRDAVRQARDDAFDAAHGNPEWAAEFDALLQTAQRSGEGTVWDACWKFLRMKNDDTWQDTLRKARDYGRRIYQKAAETGFDPVFVRDSWARCLLRYSVNVVEGQEDAGLALYTGRVNVLAEWGEDGLLRIPRRDFDVTCERRTEFVTEQKGEPHAPADLGLEWVESIRKECDWWHLGRERADATELMNQFLKDDLCLRPNDRSHKWYIELAGKYDGLEEAAEYARGFYATLKGTVWIEEDGERRPANGARVTVTDPKDGTQWHATTDPEGEYRIEDALLHTHEGADGWPRCPTFKISAEHEGDRVDDTYEGNLSEPNTSAEHTKDLVIQRQGKRVSIDCTYLHNPDKLEDYGLQFGGTVHAEVRLTTSERTSGGYTMTQLGGEATGTQKCWVEDPPGESRIENIKCPDFTAAVVDGAVWPREYNFVLDVPDAAQLTYDLVTVFVRGDRPQRSPRREWGPIMCLETPIHLGREPDAVYTHRRTDDMNAMRYELTARWATAGN